MWTYRPWGDAYKPLNGSFVINVAYKYPPNNQSQITYILSLYNKLGETQGIKKCEELKDYQYILVILTRTYSKESMLNYCPYLVVSLSLSILNTH